MTPEEERQLDAEADAYQAEADEQVLVDEARRQAVDSDPRVIALVDAARQAFVAHGKHEIAEAFCALENAQAPFRIGAQPARPRKSPEQHIGWWASVLTCEPIGDPIDEMAQRVAAQLRMAAKQLPTASRFVFLDVLAGELGRFADEVRAETHDEGEPR